MDKEKKNVPSPKTLLTKYTDTAPFFNMTEACKHNDIEFAESQKPMIVLKVDGEEYTIRKDKTVSEGKYKHYIETAIEMILFDYRGPSDGFWPPYLYLRLSEFKMIELVSLDFTFPPDDPYIIY